MHTGPHSQKLVDCRARGEFTKAVGPLRQELHKVLRSILGQACVCFMQDCQATSLGVRSRTGTMYVVALGVLPTIGSATEKAVKQRTTHSQSRKENYISRGNSPYINEGKGEILAQRALKRKKRLCKPGPAACIKESPLISKLARASPRRALKSLGSPPPRSNKKKIVMGL
eukprot:1157278-Pelagomonas_calceolata.AAC.5